MRFVNDIQGWGALPGANECLALGEVYTVDHTFVYSWHTDVFLVEFPNQPFASVCFEEV